VSYRERTATHLDLVQELTDPVWNSFTLGECSRLLDRDLPFLVWQLENLPRLEAIVCAGKTVSDSSAPASRSMSRRRERRSASAGGLAQRISDSAVSRSAAGTIRSTAHTGLGTAGEIELGQMFARALL
jgi:hypothetical protein